MREVRAIDDDKRVRLRRRDGVGGFANAPQDDRQLRHDRAYSQDREFFHGKQAGEAVRRHVTPTDTRKGDVRPQLPERAHERSAEHVTGFFRRNEKQLGRTRHWIR